jgi:hypothetical protein
VKSGPKSETSDAVAATLGNGSTMRSQFSSTALPGSSRAPGRIAGFASSQSLSALKPSWSASISRASSARTAIVPLCAAALPAASVALTVTLYVPGAANA